MEKSNNSKKVKTSDAKLSRQAPIKVQETRGAPAKSDEVRAAPQKSRPTTRKSTEPQ